MIDWIHISISKTGCMSKADPVTMTRNQLYFLSLSNASLLLHTSRMELSQKCTTLLLNSPASIIVLGNPLPSLILIWKPALAGLHSGAKPVEERTQSIISAWFLPPIAETALGKASNTRACVISCFFVFKTYVGWLEGGMLMAPLWNIFMFLGAHPSRAHAGGKSSFLSVAAKLFYQTPEKSSQAGTNHRMLI